MSKKEVAINLTDTEMNKLNNAISSIKLAQDVIVKGTIEHGNAIAHTIWEIYDIVEKDHGSLIKLSKETGINKGSISKMYTAMSIMVANKISLNVSYNKVYKVREVINVNIDRIEEIKTDLKNLTVKEILSKYAMIDCEDSVDCEDTDTSDNTDTKDTDTKVNKKEIIDNILYILSIYDISKEDLQTINKLLACL